MSLLNLETAEERMERLESLIVSFKEVGAVHDRLQTIPVENINALRQSGYTALPVEKRFGGKELSLTELISLQERIAREDGPTALCIGWHMGTMYQLALEKNWPDQMLSRLSTEVVENSVLLNTAATEKATGSPTRGGVFQTVARNESGKWILNGSKTFTTLAEELDYFLILATIEADKQVGLFLVPKDTKGIEVEKTWDMVSMGSTGSHDLHLNNVRIPADHLLKYQTKPGLPQAWLLHIPACYLGIAHAALLEASHVANTYSPSSINGTISELPNVRQKLGEARILYEQSQRTLYSVSKEWDAGNEDSRESMATALMIAKHTVVNQALAIVDLSMRVVGAHSLAHASPLSRHYRNVRAGLHNPPMDDKTVEAAAALILAEE